MQCIGLLLLRLRLLRDAHRLQWLHRLVGRHGCWQVRHLLLLLLLLLHVTCRRALPVNG